MIISRIINHKFISILAFIVVAFGVIPDIWQNPDLLLILSNGAWLVGAIYVWLKQDWAARLLAVLASAYFIRDILLEIPKFQANVESSLTDFPGFEHLVPYVILLAMLIETVFLALFIYFGFFKTGQNAGGPQTA